MSFFSRILRRSAASSLQVRLRGRSFAALCVGAALILFAVGAPSAGAASPAQGNFGLYGFDVTFQNADGTMATQAGSHPHVMTTSLGLNIDEDLYPEGRVRDLLLSQIPGLVADTTAYPRCSSLQFLQGGAAPACPLDTAVGLSANSTGEAGAWITSPLYNLTPPPGAVLRLGFAVEVQRIILDITLNPQAPTNPLVATRNTPQIIDIFANVTQLWGDPSDPAHDDLRGPCGASFNAATLAPGDLAFPFADTGKSCPVEPRPRPFLTLPTYCGEALPTSYEALSWEGDTDAGSALLHDAFGEPQPFTGCGALPAFHPQIAAQPTSRATTSASGLDFTLGVDDEGLTSVPGRAASTIRAVEVTLPEGFTANPSLAEGLEVCTEAQLAAETLAAAPGEGCPQASKIGTLQVESPLIEEPVAGSLYQAEPYHNLANDALLAFYIVFKSPKLGIIVKQPAEVIADPATGRLTTVTEEIPQLPFSSFKLHFREGARSPLITPPACGTHTVQANVYPWSGGPPAHPGASFELISGPDNSPCPAGGLPPFKPRLDAGTINNAAGRFSPFNVRLFRTDSEQEFTRFSIKLPPGIAGILAGIPKCPDAAIEAAKSRTGTEELASPSCPAASEVGRTLAGAGVGPSLAYAPGKIYLAGPYEGAPISIAAITAAKVGPFDLGTVVVRQGFKIDPRTAEVFLDPVGSDPIPHIIDGIPVHARDIRAYVDRPNFVFNPTSCERTATASTLLGSGLDFASAADDNPVVVSSPFQAADCAALGFRPKLGLRLIGGTKRGGHPKFRAHLRMRGGEANIAHARVTLPRSAFLDQSHIRTVCTRVQFAADACPPGSVYGYAKAVTPILDAPIEGPVYLRSSEHKLPDLVAALRSQEGIEFELIGRIDSLNGRIRNTFEIVPDAPVSSFTLTMQGGRKGLIVNSANLCRGKHRAIAEFEAHNGRVRDWRPVVKAKCPKGSKGAKGKRAKRNRLSVGRG